MNNDELLKNKRKRTNEKDDLINTIQENFKQLEDIFKTPDAKNIFDSIGTFSFEEYSKFLQNLSNKEYTSMSEHPKKNKEPISIDKSKLKFDYSSSQKYDEILPPTKDILKSNLESKSIPKKIKENLNKIIPKEGNNIKIDIYLRSISENINNLLNSRSGLEPKVFKQIIKIYTMLIRIKDDRYFEQDNLLYQLLQKFLDKSYKNFFNLSSFWLYNEYFLSSNKDNKEMNFKRYDEILINIIKILNNLLSNNDINIINYINDYTTFISNIPIYNKLFIEFIKKVHELYLENNKEKIDKIFRQKKDIFEALPYLENMKCIYLNIINDKNLVDIKDKEEIRKNLLKTFLNMTRNSLSTLNAKSLHFIFNVVYQFGLFEQEEIKKFVLDGLEEIKTIGEEEVIKIQQRFFAFMFLCRIKIENIKNLPKIYSELSQKTKDGIKRYFDNILSNLEQYSAEELISECNEQSEDIVISVIKKIYGSQGYKCEKNIEDEKLYRKIKQYYMKYYPNLTKGVVELSNKIPINDFFTNYNFILNKIKEYEKEQKEPEKINEKINEIFNKMNSNENTKNIFEKCFSFYTNINDKIFFYILYYIKNVKNNEFKFYKDLMVKYHIKKLIEIKNNNENNFIEEIKNIATQIKEDKNINLSEVLNLYDDYKDTKNINEIQTAEKDILDNEIDKNLINIINEKLITEKSDKFLKEYYEKLSEDNKKVFKDKILKNLSDEAKGTLDLITFTDI
jgi:hypothetical protein